MSSLGQRVSSNFIMTGKSIMITVTGSSNRNLPTLLVPGGGLALSTPLGTVPTHETQNNCVM